MSAVKLHRIPNDIRQIAVPLHFEDAGGILDRDGHAVRIQKIRAVHTGADLMIQRDPHIAGCKHKRFPYVVHDHFGFQSLIADAGIKAADHFIGAMGHPPGIAVRDRLCLFWRQERCVFAAKSHMLKLPLQTDAGRIASLSDEDLRELDAKASEDLSYYVVCVMRDSVAESTVNLKAPLVVNARTRQARQIILDQSEYTFRHVLGDMIKEES